MTDLDAVHRLEPREDVVEQLESARRVDRARRDRVLEVLAFDELHHEDRLRP